MNKHPVRSLRFGQGLLISVIIISLMISSCNSQVATKSAKTPGTGLMEDPLSFTPQVTTGVEVQQLPLADGPNWYVSTTGNDGNDCKSVANPCRNIQTAIDRAASGDIINIGAGKFDECLVSKKSLSFFGKGMDVTVIDGDKCNFGVFWFEPESQPAGSLSASLSGLTIQNGITNVNNYNRPQVGGGICANNTDLTIEGVRFYNNLAVLGGGIYFSFLMGSSPSYTLAISNTVFENNIAHDDGGAIYIEGNLSLKDVTLDHNSGDQGGSIYSEGKVEAERVLLKNGFSTGAQIYNMPPYNPGNHEDFSVTGSVFENNQGTALWIRKGTITNTTIANNEGAGVYADLTQDELYIENSTISGNKPFGVQTPAGVWMAGNGGTLTLLNVTIAENQVPGFMQVNPTSVFAVNTLIANNSVNCTAFASPIDFGAVFSGSNNISNEGTCGPSFVVVQNALLGPLQDNGGGIPTHSLLPGSPAIDNGREWKGLNTDERGQPRMLDGNGDGNAANDIGAFEAPEIASGSTITPIPVGRFYFDPAKLIPCRQGPAFFYAATGMASPGTPYPLSGISADHNWYQVEFTPQIRCWVKADDGKPSGDPSLIPLIPFTIITLTPTITATPVVCSSLSEEYCTEKYRSICEWIKPPTGGPGYCQNR
jgi:predicted outer membrane repeat protein